MPCSRRLIFVTLMLATFVVATNAFAAATPDSKEISTTPKGPFEQDAIKHGNGGAGAGGSPRPTPGVTSSSWDVGRVVLGLAAVILLFLAMVAFGKKVAPGALAPKPSGVIRVLAKSSVSPRQQLMLVQVGRRVVLVGSGGGEMNPLCEIADPAEVAELVAKIDEDKASSPRNFLAMFGKAGVKYDPASGPSDEDLGGLTEQVRGITRHFQK